MRIRQPRRAVEPVHAVRCCPAWLGMAGLLPVLGMFPPFAAAVDYSYELGVGMEYTDNVDRAPPGNARHDWIVLGGLSGWLDTQTSELRANLEGDLTYPHYLRDTTNGSLRGHIALASAWEPLPERLVLRLQNRYQDVVIDEREPLSPRNREQANATLVGPDLIVRLSPVDRVVIGARYGYTYFEESADNNRGVAALTWEHRLSPRTELTLDTSYQDVRFEGSDTVDFDRVDGRLGITHQLRGSELRLSSGHYSIDRQDRSNVDGLEWELGWDMKLGSVMRLDLSAAHDTLDAGSRLLTSGGQALTLGGINTAFSDDLLTATRYAAVLRRETVPWRYALAGTYVDEDFEDTDQDRILRTLRAAVSFRLTRDLNANASAQYAEFRYGADGRVDDDTYASVGLRRAFGRHVFAELEYGYADRRSTNDAAEFNENVVRLFVGYARLP
ncbi:MAG: outer membrane beta-barrel protein [Aquisalimonadaceae bacterium]